MIKILFIWILQDLLQTLTMGLCIIPDFFLMSIIYLALTSNSNKERQITLIWIAFIGGLFWDLRWTNLPGLTAAINGGMVALSCFLWEKTPAQGRSVGMFVFLLVCTQVFSRLINLIFWTIPSQVAFRQLIVQLLLSVPIIVILSFFYWKAYDRRV
ncbi:MAG: hypothetical protein GXZ18_03955 [Synergistaceae bacterium]|nr:hypothetical protein [Synergistaceae bacterium]